MASEWGERQPDGSVNVVRKEDDGTVHVVRNEPYDVNQGQGQTPAAGAQPTTGGSTTPISTPNGPRTIAQMRAELAAAGYNGATDDQSIMAAYTRTASGATGTTGANPISSMYNQGTASNREYFEEQKRQWQADFDLRTKQAQSDMAEAQQRIASAKTTQEVQQGQLAVQQAQQKLDALKFEQDKQTTYFDQQIQAGNQQLTVQQAQTQRDQAIQQITSAQNADELARAQQALQVANTQLQQLQFQATNSQNQFANQTSNANLQLTAAQAQTQRDQALQQIASAQNADELARGQQALQVANAQLQQLQFQQTVGQDTFANQTSNANLQLTAAQAQTQRDAALQVIASSQNADEIARARQSLDVANAALNVQKAQADRDTALQQISSAQNADELQAAQVKLNDAQTRINQFTAESNAQLQGQKQYSDLATTLLNTATQLTGPKDWLKYNQAMSGGKDIFQQLYGAAPVQAFGAPTENQAPMSVQDILAALGMPQAPQYTAAVNPNALTSVNLTKPTVGPDTSKIAVDLTGAQTGAIKTTNPVTGQVTYSQPTVPTSDYTMPSLSGAQTGPVKTTNPSTAPISVNTPTPVAPTTTPTNQIPPSQYYQNMIDWSNKFKAAKGRNPTQAEWTSGLQSISGYSPQQANALYQQSVSYTNQFGQLATPQMWDTWFGGQNPNTTLTGTSGTAPAPTATIVGPANQSPAPTTSVQPAAPTATVQPSVNLPPTEQGKAGIQGFPDSVQSPLSQTVRQPEWTAKKYVGGSSLDNYDENDTFMKMLKASGVPGLAAGTEWWQGGTALVGEKGPELVSLPTGAAVQPLTTATTSGYTNPYGNSYSGQLLPMPHQVNPAVWDSMSDEAKQLVLGAAEAGKTQGGYYSSAEWQRQLNAARPKGTAPKSTQIGWQAARGVF